MANLTVTMTSGIPEATAIRLTEAERAELAANGNDAPVVGAQDAIGDAGR